MALHHNAITVHGLVAPLAYHRVDGVRIVSTSSMEFNLVSYASREQVIPFASVTYRCAYDISGDNPIAQAYLHLKSLPEFAGATDC